MATETYNYGREFFHRPTSKDGDPEEHGERSVHSNDVHLNCNIASRSHYLNVQGIKRAYWRTN